MLTQHQNASDPQPNPPRHPTTTHYDLSVDLFEAFLDPYMKYTSGLFDTGRESLEAGSQRMLDLHVEQTRPYIKPAILDVGSGWGALLKRLRESGVDHSYLAINPSEVQNQFIKSRVDAAADVRLGTFESLDVPDGSFDLIYFVGSFCHTRSKADVLKKAALKLKPFGRLIIEDTFFISDAHFQDHHSRPATSFVQNEIFGYAEILGLPNFLNLASKQGLIIADLLDHSQSYSRTIELWMERLSRLNPHQFPQAKPFCDYMKIAQRGWGYTIANYFITMTKGGLSINKPQSGELQ